MSDAHAKALSALIGPHGGAVHRRSESIRDACLRVQVELEAAEQERIRVWTKAVESGVTYRQLGKLVGVSHSNIWRLLANPEMKRGDVLDLPFLATESTDEQPTAQAHTNGDCLPGCRYCTDEQREET